MHRATAAAGIPTGTLYLTPEGNVAVYQGLKAAVAGDLAVYDNQEIYAVTKGAIAFAEGDTVYFDGTDVQKTGFIRVGRCAAAAASGDATVTVRLLKDSHTVRYNLAAAGTALTNNTTPTNLGVAPTIPANVLKVGDRIKVRAQVIATATNSTDTLNVKFQLTPAVSGSAVDCAVTGAVDVANNDIAYIDFELTVRTIGATGTMVGTGTVALGSTTLKTVFLASTTVDTTQGQIPGIQGTWSVANAGDSCRLDVLSVELCRA